MDVIPRLLEDSLGFNIYRADLLFRRELLSALGEYEMTPEQWQVMVTLWHTERPLNQSEIVQLLSKDKHTVSRIIARLERDGWIAKLPHPVDARVTVIGLTPKGITYRDEIQNRMAGHFDRLLVDLNDEECEAVIRSLKKLRRMLGDYGNREAAPWEERQ